VKTAITVMHEVKMDFGNLSWKNYLFMYAIIVCMTNGNKLMTIHGSVKVLESNVLLMKIFIYGLVNNYYRIYSCISQPGR